MIGNSSNQIIDSIGQDSNVTITFPLKQQMNAVEFITIFMSSNMLAIIAFLAILSTGSLVAFLSTTAGAVTVMGAVILAIGMLLTSKAQDTQEERSPNSALVSNSDSSNSSISSDDSDSSDKTE